MSRPHPMLILVLALLPQVGSAADAVKKGELDGRWKVMSMSTSMKGGVNSGTLGTIHFIFARGKMHFTSSNGNVGSAVCDFSLKLDGDLKQIEWGVPDAKMEDAKSFGIYRLEKDKLTICAAASADKRPTEFKLAAEEPQSLMELVRDEIAVDPGYEKLAGTWQVSRRQGATIEGVPNNRQLELIKTMELEELPYQNQGRVTWKNAKGESLGTFLWKLDSSKSPPQIDLTGQFHSGKDQRNFQLDGVYELEGESLSLVLGWHASRPDSLKPKQPLKTARIGLARTAEERK
jgi:uncharacterized protein (TIGR03067 family)